MRLVEGEDRRVGAGHVFSGGWLSCQGEECGTSACLLCQQNYVGHHRGHIPCARSLQSCQTLCASMDCSPPGSSVHGISQARILEWAAISFSRGSFRPRDQTHVSCVSCVAGRFFTTSTTEEMICQKEKMLELISDLFPLIFRWHNFTGCSGLSCFILGTKW